jgi:molybdopterin biosynthesis enzyme
MAAAIKTGQRIGRLTPLDDVLAQIDSNVKPVAPRAGDTSASRGLTLAEDACVAQALPRHAIALGDGFAVSADAIRDAGPYAPVPLHNPAWVNAGATMPPGTDAVLPQDAVVLRGTAAEVVAPAAPGEGVLPQGADADPARPLFAAGRLLRAQDIAVLRAAGVLKVSLRVPAVAIVHGGQSGTFVDAALAWTKHALERSGGRATDGANLQEALREGDADAVIAIGGTGSGERDDTVTTLAANGTLFCHGIAIAPGATAAFGFAGAKPVLLVPGRLDAAIACWLLIGAHMLARLCGREPDARGRSMLLSRKIASAIGMDELVPVACTDGEAEPLASGYLSLEALARADGWMRVPAQSEGYPAGTAVTARPFP